MLTMDQRFCIRKQFWVQVYAKVCTLAMSRGTDINLMSSLIENGAALPFTSHAAAPTVTMPRLKALTTGSIPSFLDLILNFAESDTTSILSNQDTWLAQIHKRGGKVIMFGDDTWLKLFPTSFERSDGTSSFFVAVCICTVCSVNIEVFTGLGFHRGR